MQCNASGGNSVSQHAVNRGLIMLFACFVSQENSPIVRPLNVNLIYFLLFS